MANAALQKFQKFLSATSTQTASVLQIFYNADISYQNILYPGLCFRATCNLWIGKLRSKLYIWYVLHKYIVVLQT